MSVLSDVVFYRRTDGRQTRKRGSSGRDLADAEQLDGLDPLARSLPQAFTVPTPTPQRITDTEGGGTRLAWRLFLSHGVLATILLGAVAITLSGLIGMNFMLAEIKNRHLADFEEDERLHRAAWSVETAARHGMLACERSDTSDHERSLVTERLTAATQDLGSLLQQSRTDVSPQLTQIARGYLDFGGRVLQGDICERLGDSTLTRQRLLLDENITDAWIDKLRELRLAIVDREQAAQALGTWTITAGVTFGVLAFVAAALIARFVARGVTVPLSLLAGHARRLGEGDFSRLPSIDGPYEVTELRRELERMRARLAEVSQLKDAFLGSVSHDLRTPLAHIREALGLLADGTLGPLTAQQQRVNDLAIRACEREIRLVSALLDLTRIRSGRPLMLTPHQAIDDVILNAIQHVGEDASRAEVSIDVVSDEPITPMLLDAMLVEAALVNVLSNAIIASPRAGTIVVRRDVVTTAPPRLATPGPWLRVSVTDRGPGVAAHLHEKIFEPFFTKTLNESTAGSGLGLPLAREMIRGHGGELSLLESADSGATFVIWLPVHPNATLKASATTHAEPNRTKHSPTHA